MISRAIHLAMWSGFRAGASSEASHGEIEIMFHGDKISPVQRAAHASIVASASALQALILEAIVQAYPAFREWHPRPKTVTTKTLRNLIELYGITVLNDGHEAMGYLAYSFSCAWDPSGFSVVTHGPRVVAAGDDVLGYPIKDPARSKPKPKVVTAAARKKLAALADKAAKRNPKSLSVAKGELEITLAVWAGFRAGENGTLSKGKVLVSVGGDAMITSDDEITAEHTAAYRHAVEHASTVQHFILRAIEQEYPKIKARVADVDTEMPTTIDASALRDLVEITAIHIHQAHAAGVGYVGYQFAAAWDSEHALGVMMHLDRVVALGGADTAILSWIAERDRKKRKRPTTRNKKVAVSAKRPRSV
jgi:hypothetical protein